MDTRDQDDVERVPAGDDVERGLRLADSLLKVGDNQRAAEAYADVAERFVGRGDVMQAVAVCFRAMQVQPTGFVSGIGEAVVDSLGSAGRPLLERALASHEEQRNYGAAANVVRRLIDQDPDSVELRVKLAHLLHAQGKDADASDLLWATAQVLERDGNNAELIDVGQEILEIDPKHRAARRSLARVFLRVGDLADCLRVVTPLVRDEDDAVGLAILARLQVELGRNDRAVDVLRRLAAALVSVGQAEDADELLAKASKWAFDDEDYRATLSDLRERVHQGEPIEPAEIDDILDSEVVEVPIELATAG